MKLDFRHICLIILVSLFLSGTAVAANYVVSGAPESDANGLYVENGTSDGVPKYTKGYWNLERQGSGWFIIYGEPGGMWAEIYRNDPNSSDVPPNDGNWEDFASGSIPMTIMLAPANIPSLGTWGALIMLTLLTGIAIAVIRKSRFPDTGARA